MGQFLVAKVGQFLVAIDRDGVVARKVFHEVPPRVQYSLTPLGVSLQAALRPLCEWGTVHMKRIGAEKSRSEAAKTKPAAQAAQPVAR